MARWVREFPYSEDFRKSLVEFFPLYILENMCLGWTCKSEMDNVHLKKRKGKIGCINSILKIDNAMVYNKKLTYIVIILLFLLVYISLSSSNKPSKKTMINIIYKIKFIDEYKDEYNFDMTNFNVKDSDLKSNRFNILNEFVSKHNGRYCILVDYEIEFIPDKSFWIGSNERYSFERKGNQWFGWKGWGPGEY